MMNAAQFRTHSLLWWSNLQQVIGPSSGLLSRIGPGNAVLCIAQLNTLLVRPCGCGGGRGGQTSRNTCILEGFKPPDVRASGAGYYCINTWTFAPLSGRILPRSLTIIASLLSMLAGIYLPTKLSIKKLPRRTRWWIGGVSRLPPNKSIANMCACACLRACVFACVLPFVCV